MLSEGVAVLTLTLGVGRTFRITGSGSLRRFGWGEVRLGFRNLRVGVRRDVDFGIR